MLGIVLIDPKYPGNLAGVVRAAHAFGVPRVFWTGKRINLEGMTRIPRELRMNEYKDVVWKNLVKPFDEFPRETPVCVERFVTSENLIDFNHPEEAVYIFGPEDGEVPQVIRRLCHRFVSIPSRSSLNLASAVNITLYDRKAKEITNG